MHAKETRAEWRGAWPTGKLTCVHEHLGGADRADGGERVGQRGDGRGQVEDEDGLREAGGGGEVAVACEEKRACLARS